MGDLRSAATAVTQAKRLSTNPRGNVSEVLVVIAIGAGVVCLIALGLSVLWERRRARRLRQRFGPEYVRTVRAYPDREAAEIELEERLRRYDDLDLRGLSDEARRGYLDRFVLLQDGFESDPRGALEGVDSLVREILEARGYPVESAEQLSTDLSVDHPDAAQEYRAGWPTAPLQRPRQMRAAFARYERITYDLLGPTAATTSEPQ